MRRKYYNTCNNVLSSIVLITASAWAQGVQAATDEELEPCMNGGVSATGLYISQSVEDATMAQLSDAKEPDTLADESDC